MLDANWWIDLLYFFILAIVISCIITWDSGILSFKNIYYLLSIAFCCLPQRMEIVQLVLAYLILCSVFVLIVCFQGQERTFTLNITQIQHFNFTTICGYDVGCMLHICTMVCCSSWNCVAVKCMLYTFVMVLLLRFVLISGPLFVPCALYHSHYCHLFMDSDNVKILLDRDKILQMGGDPEKLAVVGDIADVSQDDFLLIHFPHFKVLKQTIYCNVSLLLLQSIDKNC